MFMACDRQLFSLSAANPKDYLIRKVLRDVSSSLLHCAEYLNFEL